MPKHNVTKINDFDIARDGRFIVLNFADENNLPVSLKLSTMALEQANHEISFAIVKARQLANMGVIPFLRPKKWRAELLNEQPVVVISFGLPNGLEVHYGIEATDAPVLARQILDASARGMTAKKPTAH